MTHIERLNTLPQTIASRFQPGRHPILLYTRAIDIAHILPVLGGKFSLQNCYALCPNCHHLFDHNLLPPNEQEKLKEIHASRG